MKKSIVFLMNRWDSSKGGIQTVNRELLLAIARIRPDWECIGVVMYATEAEINQAYRNGVNLISGTTADDWTTVVLSDELRNIDASSVLAVVGHSSFSGDQAIRLRNFWFQEACAVQFVHMDPMRTENVKEQKQDSYVAARESKQKDEIEISKRADVVVCIGPRLYRVTRDLFAAHQLEYSRVHRLDCGLDVDEKARIIEPEQPTVVCLGRTESMGVKGLDIFAEMAGIIDKSWVESPITRSRPLKPRFIVRGAENNPEELQENLLSMATKVGGAPEIIVRPYTSDKASLSADLRGATAFVMPSREEGFGLVACEALSHGTPIIVSQQSGIAELILETAKESGQNFANCVVDSSGKTKIAAKRFADSVMPLLSENDPDRTLYSRLRGHLLSVCSWDAGATTFSEIIENAYEERHTAIRAGSIKIGGTAPYGNTSISLPSAIEQALATERDALMSKQGVIAVGTRQAIVVTVEKDAKPNLPEKIGGFDVVTREVEGVKLTSKDLSGGYDLLVNGELRAAIGLFGINEDGKAFGITVAHALAGQINPK